MLTDEANLELVQFNHRIFARVSSLRHLGVVDVALTASRLYLTPDNAEKLATALLKYANKLKQSQKEKV